MVSLRTAFVLSMIALFPALHAQEAAKEKAPPQEKEKPKPSPTPQDIERERAQALAKAAAADKFSLDRSIRPILELFCYRCHNDEKHKGDVNLTRDHTPRLIAENRKVWLTVIEVLESKQMPPKKEKQMTDDQRKLLVAFINKTLGSLDCGETRDPGKSVIRRLNRTEYDNSILELTGLNLRLAEDFSPDSSGYGFDNIAEALALSPVLVEQYHQAAVKLLSEIVDRKAAHPEPYRRIYFAAPSA